MSIGTAYITLIFLIVGVGVISCARALRGKKNHLKLAKVRKKWYYSHVDNL